MSDSSAVGYRIRGIEPTELSTYPDSTKLMFWGFVVKFGLAAKDKELAKGWDKDGKTHRLSPKTIKYRKSEVGPVHKRAPRLTPALKFSRVRALLRGRAHLASAEFFWAFDSVTGASFAKILRYSAENGHDVFGLSDAGTAWVRDQSLREWETWKRGQGISTAEEPTKRIAAMRQTRAPISKISIKGHLDIENFDLTGNDRAIKSAISAGRFPGLRRLNLRGEQWRPGAGIEAPRLNPAAAGYPRLYKPLAAVGPIKPIALSPIKPPIPEPVKPPEPKPVAKPIVPAMQLSLDIFARKAIAAARLVPESQHYAAPGSGKVFIIDAYEIFREAYPDITLDQFKDRLNQLRLARLIDLAQADMSGSFGSESVRKNMESTLRISEFTSVQVIRI
jgi:hypothetical protein